MAASLSRIKPTAVETIRYRIIQGSEVLTLSRDYFRLRKPTDRRIYEVVRKHCGEQDEWSISLELLQKKVGASSHRWEFKSMVKELVERDHLPDSRNTLLLHSCRRHGSL
jgi:plasmid replication initiation protein